MPEIGTGTVFQGIIFSFNVFFALLMNLSSAQLLQCKKIKTKIKIAFYIIAREK